MDASRIQGNRPPDPAPQHDVCTSCENVDTDTLRLAMFSVEKTSDAVFWIDENGQFRYVNEAACASLGYSREELLSLGVCDIDPAFSADDWPNHWKSLTNKRSSTIESLHQTKDGRLIAVEIAANLVELDGRSFACTFARNISARKQAEETLRRMHDELEKRVAERTSELEAQIEQTKNTQARLNKINLAVSQSTDHISIADMDGYIIYANPAWAHGHGWEPDELVGQHLSINHTPEQLRDMVEPFLGKLKKRKAHQAYVGHKRKDGTTFDAWMNTIIAEDDDRNPIAMLAIARDITEKEQSQQLLRLQRELGISLSQTDNLVEAMNHIMEAAKQINGIDSGGFYLLDEETQTLNLITHYSLSDEFIEKVVSFGPETPQMQFIRSGESFHGQPQLLKSANASPDGEDLRFVSVIPIIENGDIVGVINFASHVRDTFLPQECDTLEMLALRIGSVITRVRTEAALRKSEKRYRDLVESQQDLIVRVDGKGDFTFVNDAYCHMFGKSREQLIGSSFRPLVHEDDLPPTLEAMKGLEHPPYRINLEQRAMTVDGWRWIAWEDYAIKDDAGKTIEIQGIGRDITRIKQAEEHSRQHLNELAHVTRLSTIGEMASSLAHEINQPLSAVANYLGSAVRRLDPSSQKEAEILDDIQPALQQTKRAAEFVRHIKDFIRKREPQWAPLDLNSAIRQAVSLVDDLIRTHSVVAAFDLDESLPAARADNIQIQQVVINLARNAIEAMADNPDLPNRAITFQTRLIDNRWAQIEIRDTGPGIDVDNTEHIFDAFFTTKPGGTGLGLSISRSIIEAHGGTLALSTTSPSLRGAAFRFTLPVCSEDPCHVE